MASQSHVAQLLSMKLYAQSHQFDEVHWTFPVWNAFATLCVVDAWYLPHENFSAVRASPNRS